MILSDLTTDLKFSQKNIKSASSRLVFDRDVTLIVTSLVSSEKNTDPRFNQTSMEMEERLVIVTETLQLARFASSMEDAYAKSVSVILFLASV